MKFRVERDVLADAVAWAARSLPVRPSVPVLAGLLIDASDDGLVALHLRLRDLGARHGRPRRSPTRAGPWSPAGCSPTSAAACPAKPVEMTARRRQGALTCGGRAVHPADDAGRGLPEPARRCRPRRAPSQRRVRRTPSPRRSTAAGRDDMLPGAHRRPDRDRRVDHHACWPPTGSGSRCASSSWYPGHPRRVDGRAGPGPGAGRHRQVADGRVRGHHRPGPGGAARGSSASRARPPAACAGRRRGSSTASSPRSAPVPGRAPDDRAGRQRRRSIESVKRVSLVAERNTPVRLTFADGVLTLEAGRGDEAQASEAIEADIDGEPITDRVQPAVPPRRARRAIDEPVVELAFTQASQAGRHQRCGGRECGPTTRPQRAGSWLPLPPDAEASAVVGRVVGAPAGRQGAWQIGLIGLGKMGGNMRDRPAPRRPHRRRLRPEPRRHRRRLVWPSSSRRCPRRGWSG